MENGGNNCSMTGCDSIDTLLTSELAMKFLDGWCGEMGACAKLVDVAALLPESEGCCG